MCDTNAIGDFDLNLVKIRKPLEFPDTTIQSTAYTGAGGVPTLEEVLLSGNDAEGLDVVGVDSLEVSTLVASTQIQLIPTGSTTVNFLGEINQEAINFNFAGNQLTETVCMTRAGQGSSYALGILDSNADAKMIFVPNAANNNYNPIVNAGDNVIVGSSSQPMVITRADATTTNGIRFDATSITLGVGGTADTPTQNLNFNTTTGRTTYTGTGAAGSGLFVSSNNASPNVTLAVTDTSGSGNQTWFIPKIGDNQFNPLSSQNAQTVMGYSTNGANTTTLEIIPYANVSSGIRMIAGNDTTVPASVLIGCGGSGDSPSNNIKFASTGTVEVGNSHQFSNCVAQYDAAGLHQRVIPSCPAIGPGANVIPSFEVLNYHLTGDATDATGTMALQSNITTTANYAVFPTVYYGLNPGVAGIYNAPDTSGALSPIVITSINTGNFTWYLKKNNAQSVDIYIVFLVIYNMYGTAYPKTYTSP